MKIRKCHIEDIPRVLSLQKTWLKKEGPYGFVLPGQKELKAKIGGYFLVAEDDDEIIGFSYGAIRNNKNMCIFRKNTEYFEIEDIYVSSDFRNGGVGSRLINALIKKAKSRNIRQFLIYSSMKDLAPVIRFYQKHRFKSWALQMFRKDPQKR